MGIFGETIRVMTYFKDSDFFKDASHDLLNSPFATVVVSSKLLLKLCGKLSQNQCSHVAFQLIMENLKAGQVINRFGKIH